MTRQPASLALRLWLGLIFGGVFWFLCLVLYPQLFFLVGLNHDRRWFIDSFSILASNDAASLGLDVYQPNPLDPLNGRLSYSHWWLHLHDLGLTRADNVWLSLTLAGGFFAVAVARLRPKEPRELFWYLLLLCSSPVVLAVERANYDLVIFLVLAPVVPCLISQYRPLRWLAVALIALATGLKFYPAIAFLVLLDEGGGNVRETRWRLLVAALLLAVVGLNIAPDIARLGELAPRRSGLLTFGSVNLLLAFGLDEKAALFVGLGFVVAVAGFFLRWRPFNDWTVPAENRAAWLGFVLGAALLAGCFFTGRNIAYRWIFALWMAPFLWILPHDATAPRQVRQLAAVVVALLIVAVLADAIASGTLYVVVKQAPLDTVVRWAHAFFLIEQPVTWILFGCLVGFLTQFTRSSLRFIFAPK